MIPYSEDGDIVWSKKNKKGKKMYRIKVIINVSPEKLVKAFETHKEDITKWNQTMARHETVKKFDNGARIFYQLTKANGPGDIVSARDWFLISKSGMRGNVWFQGGCSVDYPGGPQGEKCVHFDLVWQ